MLNIIVVGASGYSGAELVRLLARHPGVAIKSLIVSRDSEDQGKVLTELYPHLAGYVEGNLMPLYDIPQQTKQIDTVFLATDHTVSHQLAPLFLAQGCVVFDLSGAFRLKNSADYLEYYGFEHQHQDWLSKAVYGLAEWHSAQLKTAQLIAVPGCYPTAAQLALLPLTRANLLDPTYPPIINAVSGVSGAGRRLSRATHFCEVSLQPYGLFKHRHQPEISEQLGIEVVFSPHLGNFQRGILATITCRLVDNLCLTDVQSIYLQVYQHQPLIRLYDKQLPALQAVVGSPFCDLGFAIQGRYLIIVATEDNLLKGAAASAIQCMNIRYGFDETLSLL